MRERGGGVPVRACVYAMSYLLSVFSARGIVSVELCPQSPAFANTQSRGETKARASERRAADAASQLMA